MKKLLGSAWLILGLLAGTAHAALIVDTVEQDVFLGLGGKHSYTHNLNDHGFVLGSALSGTLDIEVTSKFKWFPSTILFVVDDFDFDTGGISLFANDFANELGVKALGSLNNNGYLNISVSSVLGGFTLGNSTLSVTTATVPGPGVLGLMVIGLVGLGFSRRKSKPGQA